MTFGIVICNNSNYPELTRCMAVQNAAVLFIRTNNSLPNGRASLDLNADLSAAGRSTDVALATQHRIWVIRAEIAGRNGKLTCFGSSEIVDPEGNVIQEARLERTELLVAAIDLDGWHRELRTRVSRRGGHIS